MRPMQEILSEVWKRQDEVAAKAERERLDRLKKEHGVRSKYSPGAAEAVRPPSGSFFGPDPYTTTTDSWPDGYKTAFEKAYMEYIYKQKRGYV